jgi:hypothetical protein
VYHSSVALVDLSNDVFILLSVSNL